MRVSQTVVPTVGSSVRVAPQDGQGRPTLHSWGLRVSSAVGPLAVSRTARSFIKLSLQSRLCTDAEQPEERAELLPETPPPEEGR